MIAQLRWPTTPLGELTERPIQYGVLKPGPFVPDGVPLIRVGDISTNSLDGSRLYRISSELDAEFARTRLRGGELLVSVQGTIGKVALVPEEYAGANVSRTIAVVALKKGVNAEFVRAWLLFLETEGRYKTVGSTRASLNIGDLRKISIPQPPLEVQRRIACVLTLQWATLGTLRGAVDAQLSAISKLDQGALRDLFMDPRARDSERRPLGELCDLVNGNAYRESDWSKSGAPIIRIQNLKDPSKQFNYWDGPLDGRVVVHPGDVLLAWSGTPGTSFGAHRWRGSEGVLNQHIFRVDFDRRELDPEWVVIAINEQLQVMIERAQGAVGLRHITKGETQALSIAVPRMEQQRELAAIYSRRREGTTQIAGELAAQRANIDALSDAILREAFADAL